ncbi:AAA family ATPase [Brevibacterium sp. CSND-B09]|uniref:AAA family ATPase n=1 Tax=Brevibacterium sp. CSND-B09 TaxID=3462571 RepID=UPI00406A9449
MPAAGIISTGNTYRLFDDSVQTHRDLPVGTYSVQFSPFSGFSLLRVEDLQVGAERIYGGHGAKIDRIMKAYNVTNRSLGVLFTGDKGMGKSLSMRMLAQHATETLGLPVIKVESNHPGLADYLDDLGEAVVVFDEFEKVFNKDGDNNEQDQFLGLFDGVSTTKRMYVISANNVHDLSSYLVNRPGRFHYHIRHDYPEPSEVRQYLHDEVPDIADATVEEIVVFTRKTKINYDHLRAIAFELRLGGEFKDTIKDINIKNIGDPLYSVTAVFSDGYKSTRTTRGDLFGSDPIRVEFEQKDRVDVMTTIDTTQLQTIGDALVAPAGSFEGQAFTGYRDDVSDDDPKYKIKSITIELFGQESYAY